MSDEYVTAPKSVICFGDEETYSHSYTAPRRPRAERQRDEETTVHLNRRDVMFAFAASAVQLIARRLAFAASAALGGCATPRRRLPTGSSSAPATARASTTGVGYRLVRPKTVLQIVHGAAEHASRYDRFAQACRRQRLRGLRHRPSRSRPHATALGPHRRRRPRRLEPHGRRRDRLQSTAARLRIRVPSSYCSATASARSWRRTTSSAAPTCWTG